MVLSVIKMGTDRPLLTVVARQIWPQATLRSFWPMHSGTEPCEL